MVPMDIDGSTANTKMKELTHSISTCNPDSISLLWMGIGIIKYFRCMLTTKETKKYSLLDKL